MFGLFGKKDLENDSFNNMLITALAESVRKNGNLPTEAQIFKTCEELLEKRNAKLTSQQINSIRCSVILFKMSSPADELLPLLKKFIEEIPRGGRGAYDQIFNLLSRHGIVIDDAALDFMKQYGLK